MERSAGPRTESSSGESPPVIVVVPASVAACTDPISNDSGLCELSTGTQGMNVDGSNNAVMTAATTAYVAFDLEVPPGSELVSAELHLTAPDDPNAESMTQTGEVWQAVALTDDSLSMGQPFIVGDNALAPDQGGVAVSELAVWTLPISEIDLSATLYLAVVPTTNEGVDSWNAQGFAPPQILLELSGG